MKPLVRPKRPVQPKRYSRPVPGDPVQMDTMKIARGVYQYTAIDDCSRFRVLAVYPRRNARNTLLFLDHVIEEMPFPIQPIPTDRGGEFFAESVQRRLMSEYIKFRPIPPPPGTLLEVGWPYRAGHLRPASNWISRKSDVSLARFDDRLNSPTTRPLPSGAAAVTRACSLRWAPQAIAMTTPCVVLRHAGSGRPVTH